jgi:hypothetical protein
MPRTTVAVEEINLQLEARLIPDVLAMYVDQTLGPSAAGTREVFALIEQLPADGFIKVGKFFLPYGLRLVDDQEFIRERTGFSYNTPDLGVEFGIEPGPLSLFVSLTNGSQGAGENDDGKQIAGSAALIFRHFRFGASVSRNDAADARRGVVGGFGGFTVGRLTALGEFDFIFDSFATDSLEQFAAFAEADLLIVRGLNAKLTYGFLDPDADIAENAQVRMRFGVEWFPVPFFQLSGFYNLFQDIPQATTDVDVVSLELHMYF